MPKWNIGTNKLYNKVGFKISEENENLYFYEKSK